MSIVEIGGHWRRLLSKAHKRCKRRRFECFFPGCDSYAVKSHSQQKESQLRSIAVNGKVYAVDGRFTTLYDLDRRPDDPMPIVLTGINTASTFPGFCRTHDREMFSPIETRPLAVRDYEQATRLFLRATIYEFSQKRYVRSFAECMVEAIQKEFNPFISPEPFEEQVAEISLWMRESGDRHVARAFNAMSSPLTDGVRFAWEVVPRNLGISCCAYYCPYTPLTLDDQRAAAFHVIPSPTETHVIIAWAAEDHLDLAPYFEDSHKSERLQHIINFGAFLGSEDTCISPDLWDCLTEDAREKTALAMRHPVFRDPLTSAPRIITL